MSRENNPSFKAGGVINIKRCVKISGDNTVIQCTATTDKAIGIARRAQRDTPGLVGSDSTVAANAGDSVEVYGPGEVAPAEAGAAVTAGDFLTPNASGQVITATAAANLGGVGWALESASGAG